MYKQIEIGVLTMRQTPPLTLPNDAQRLLVNSKVAGSLEVALLDPETGTALPGFESSVPFSGDAIAAAITWGDTAVQRLQGDIVQLRFTIKDGEVFSFWFE